jgi:HlyD family secretion protein
MTRGQDDPRAAPRALPALRPLSRLRATAALFAVGVTTGCGDGDGGRLISSGHVEATEVRIATKVAGRLDERPIEEGTTVAAGQVLARIDTTDLRIALRQAGAERAQADADLRLRIAGARPEEIAEMEAQVRQSQADLEGAQRDFDRAESLLERGSGTVKSRDDARTRRDIAAARLAAAGEALGRIRSGSRREEIDAARARRDAADARLAILRQQIDDATVHSPIEGVVTETIADAGELLPAGAPICIVTDLAHPWLTAYVGGLDLPRLRLGSTVRVRADDGQVRAGRITFIAPQAEFTPKNVQTRQERLQLVFRIKVGLDNADGLFKPGMPAEAWFEEPAPPGGQDAPGARP